jgi:hypothetical protein
MSQQLKIIHQCVELLEEQGYYGDFVIVSTAEELCERFSTQDGDEVDDKTYEVIKEWLE